jgi:hypothetical protein
MEKKKELGWKGWVTIGTIATILSLVAYRTLVDSELDTIELIEG